MLVCLVQHSAYNRFSNNWKNAGINPRDSVEEAMSRVNVIQNNSTFL